ncbi:antibiotic biosynthesis monooxygenase [Alphaproteobacteria bacterium]|nr:antibiotic biosynthesis monooxygenase [Alphaproteobacteria bacterium]
MYVVIFEVEPRSSGIDDYLRIATQLKEELEKIEGFISIERYQSLNEPKKLLSLSTWENETAIALWRNQLTHKSAQQEGRAFLFENYRIRVASVTRDYDLSSSPWV